jgi:hypothetical protein
VTIVRTKVGERRDLALQRRQLGAAPTEPGAAMATDPATDSDD